MLAITPCVAWDDAPMVEYGGGISDGPAGQVSGGSSPFGGNVDVGASIGDFINDSMNTISTLPPHMLILGVLAIFVFLLILRRAF